jgi:hypothetical protein
MKMDDVSVLGGVHFTPKDAERMGMTLPRNTGFGGGQPKLVLSFYQLLSPMQSPYAKTASVAWVRALSLKRARRSGQRDMHLHVLGVM